jgi:hypothetical protein
VVHGRLAVNYRVVLQDHHLNELRQHLLQGAEEQAAVCLGGRIATDRLLAILVREVHSVPQDALVTQSGAFIEIDPEWLASLVKRARQDNLSVLIAHSHPFSVGHVAFSGTDTHGQRQLIPKLQGRVSGVPHAEAVFGQSAIEALMWPPGELEPQQVQEIRVLGARMDDIPTSGCPGEDQPVEPRLSRQVLFLGLEGQRRLSRLRVGVVGVGGNGSPVSIQLIHLGVGSVVAVDPEGVEETNRNRLIDSHEGDDEKTPKVEIPRRYAARVAQSVEVTAIQAPVEEAWTALRDCDVIFGCTDDLLSRYVLNRLATQYLIPLIDTGVEVEAPHGNLRSIAGRVNVVRPGRSCLEALGMTSEEAAIGGLRNRRRPGYVPDDPSAAAMPANMLIAGAAALEFLKLVHGLFGGSPPDRYWAYSARSGELRSCETSHRDCPACSSFAALGDAGPSPSPPEQKDHRPAGQVARPRPPG